VRLYFKKIISEIPKNIISCYIMTIKATPSVSTLNTLYASLCQTAQQRITKYLNSPADSDKYDKMVTDVFAWLKETGSLYKILGGDVNDLNGLRVQVILPDGVTVLDTSKAKADHEFDKVGVLKTVAANSKLSFYINENQASRSYNMGALLSNSGVFSQVKYSNSTGVAQYYLAVRQGATPSEPYGNVVVSMDA